MRYDSGLYRLGKRKTNGGIRIPDRGTPLGEGQYLRKEKNPVIGEAKIELIQNTALILANEFLFNLFYLINEYGRPFSTAKLSKELQLEESVLKDHVSVLVRLGFLSKTREKYYLVKEGKEALGFIKEGAGEIAPKPKIVFYDDYPVTYNDDSMTLIIKPNVASEPALQFSQPENNIVPESSDSNSIRSPEIGVSAGGA